MTNTLHLKKLKSHLLNFTADIFEVSKVEMKKWFEIKVIKYQKLNLIFQNSQK